MGHIMVDRIVFNVTEFLDFKKGHLKLLLRRQNIRNLQDRSCWFVFGSQVVQWIFDSQEVHSLYDKKPTGF